MEPRRFYVYRHLTADTNIPFYVGKGNGYRAKTSGQRNKYWHSIVKKHGFTVEYIAKDLNELEAFYLEAFYIKLYGRKPNGLLVNQTDGGDGQSGVLWNESRREYMSRVITGKILKPVDAEKLISDYLKLNSLKKASKLNGICIATAMKYIPKNLRQESRSANGRLNSIRLLGRKKATF